MLGFFVKLVSGWKLLPNVTKSSNLTVVMVLDTSLQFYRKPSSATCFIIYFNMYSQIKTLWKQCHVQRERDDTNMKICQYLGKEFMCHWVKSMKKVYANFSFSRDINLKQNYIVIFILLSLVNICQNYIALYNVFLYPQCIVSQEGFQRVHENCL